MHDNEELIKALQAGDESALAQLVSNNMGLVKKLALRFVDRGVEYEDLVQIGSIGMIKAARSFDFSFECVFSTYAVPLIAGEIRRYLRDDGLIKVSRQLKRQGTELMRMKEQYINEHGCEPRLSELAELCSIPVDEAVLALDATSGVRSLSESVGDDDCELGDIISDKENDVDRLTDRIALSEAIKKLPECERQIIVLRYFKELSQQQTGQALGLSQVKVSREEKKIIEKLRAAL